MITKRGKRIFTVVTAVIVCLAAGVLWLIYPELFGKSESLGFDKPVRKIEICEFNSDRDGVMYIEDKEQTERFMEYLNGMELVKSNKELNNRDNKAVFITLFLDRSDNGNYPHINIIGNYLFFSETGYDWKYTAYYIKDNDQKKRFMDHLDHTMNNGSWKVYERLKKTERK